MPFNYGLDVLIPHDGDPDPSLPWADDDDALLTPGSLLLIEPAHSALPVVGTPAVGGTIPNVAWKRARDMVGAAVFTGRVDNGTAGQAGKIMTVTAVASGKVQPGMLLTIPGVSAVTVCVKNQLTGTPGGIGTYTLTNTDTDSAAVTYNVASTAINAVALDAASAGNVLRGLGPDSFFNIERTPKGGLHIAMTQVNDTGATAEGAHRAIESLNAVKAWLLGNANHAFYTSMWEMVTRPASTAAPVPPQMIINTRVGGGTSNYHQIYGLADGSANGTYPSAGAPVTPLGKYDSQGANPNVLGLRHRAVATPQAVGVLSGISVLPFNVGHPDAWGNNASYGNKSASRILYRMYVEDMTVSGRTYADILAQDQALFAAAFGSGGRYAGDTFTPPLA